MKSKKYLPFIILFLCIVSTFIVNFTYFSLVLSSFMVILSLLFSRENTRIMLITIIISIATIVTDIFILYNKQSISHTDVFEDTNILLGSWNYNFDNSSYIFNDDYTFIQYDDVNNLNNYCIGNYKYSYGGTSNDGIIIYQDDNYYYYNLNFDIEYCINDNIKNNEDIIKKFIFGISKDNYSDLIFMDIENNYAFKVNKIKE